MRVVVDDSPVRFLDACEPLFEKDEAQNNLIWGVASALAEGRRFGPKPPVLIRVEEDRKTTTCAVVTPPHGLIVTAGTLEAMSLIAKLLHQKSFVFPGAVGAMPGIETFARLWEKAAEKTARILMHQRMYKLTRVTFPPFPGGKMIQAEAIHTTTVEAWMEAFAKEAVPLDLSAPERFREAASPRILSGDLYLWEKDGKVVSSACLSGVTRHGVRISMVFTPPEYRKKGYAGALVAHLSDFVLKSGKDFCVLYTDESNSTSNNVYQSVGYECIGESRHYLFD